LNRYCYRPDCPSAILGSAPCVMLHFVSGISSLYLSVNFILVPVPPSPTHLFPHASFLPFSDSPLCTFITPSLFHSRLKTYLFHKSYPVVFTSSSRTAFTNYCPCRFFGATQLLLLFLVFFLFFLSVPCAILGWQSRQLLSTC